MSMFAMNKPMSPDFRTLFLMSRMKMNIRPRKHPGQRVEKNFDLEGIICTFTLDVLHFLFG